MTWFCSWLHWSIHDAKVNRYSDFCCMWDGQTVICKPRHSMNPNFPHKLAIHASNPNSALRKLVVSNHSILDYEHSVSDEEILMSAQNLDIKSYGIAGRIWHVLLVVQKRCI